MYRWLLAIALGTLACGCEDGESSDTTGGSGTTTTSSETTTSSDTTTTTSDTTTTTSDTTTTTTTTTAQRGPCLPRPTDLPRPPTGQLPCELFPPVP